MATQQLQARRISPERWFFSGMALAMAASIIIGFLPTYFARGLIDGGQPLLPLTPLIHVHAALFTGWMLLFVVQTLLVANGRVDIHRKLGLTAMAMLPVMMLVAMLSAFHEAARASGPPIVPPLSWLAVPLLSVPVFGGLIGLSLAWRRKPQSHKRLMLLAMVEMTSPAFSRWPWPAFVPAQVGLYGFSDLFVLALMAWDVKRFGRVHRTTWFGAAWLVGSQVLRLTIWQTGPWLAFARWAFGLAA